MTEADPPLAPLAVWGGWYAAPLLGVLAGLPHHVLTVRDVARRGTPHAPVRVAAVRTMATLAAVVALAGLVRLGRG